MSERWIWVVRVLGIVLFLVLMYLLMNLHARLVRMNEEQGTGGRPAASGCVEPELQVVERGNVAACPAHEGVA